jgi:hypothetical protein
MNDTVKTLVTSKRFIVTTIVLVVCAAFVVAGKMPVSDFLSTLEKLGALLAALYGIENAADALSPTINVTHAPVTNVATDAPPAANAFGASTDRK